MNSGPRRLLPSIASLRALEALDRLGSATAAADELSQTQGAVSRQLQSLEAQLGVTLILRERRRMVLTPAARAYAADIRQALHQIGRAALHLTSHSGSGQLNLAILPTFGMRWLVPRLSDFARLHPEITINMATRLAPFNFAADPFDAALHFGDADWPGTDALRLKSESVVAVCAPGLLAGAALSGPADLLRLPLLHIETRPRAWHDWLRSHGHAADNLPGTLYDQFSTITQAALHGLGVALLPDYLAEQDLATGRLVRAWGGPTASPGAYWLVWPARKSQDRALSVFRDWLAGQTEDEDRLPR